MPRTTARGGGMGGRLFAYRTARNLTLRDVYDASGVAVSYIARLEREGDWDGASLGRIALIAKAVGVTPGDLIGAEYLWHGTINGQTESEG